MSPGPWVEKVETRVRIDTDNNGETNGKGNRQAQPIRVAFHGLIRICDRLRHEVEMLALPLNFLPEAVDYFVCQNDEDDFPDRPGTPFGSDEPVLVTESFSGVPIDELIGHGPLDEVRALRCLRQGFSIR